MNAKLVWFAGIAFAFSSSLAIAQTASAKQGNGDRPDPNHSANAPQRENQILASQAQNEAQTAMYEDIEIMRRLLSSKLENLYPPRAWERWIWDSAPGSTSAPLNYLRNTDRGVESLYGLPSQSAPQGNQAVWSHPLSSASAVTANTGLFLNQYLADPKGGLHWTGVQPAHSLDIEGSYLPGYGVVYTVTLPPPPRRPKTESTKPQPKPLTDWERIRKQLHGEKELHQAQQSPAPPKEVSLTDVILKTLFENGHHFVRLNHNEKLTVAVTFRPAQQQGIPVTAANSAADPFASSTRSIAPGSPTATSISTGSAVIGDPTTGTGTKAPSSAHDYQLLGDLHLRQGQANDALNAYRRALNELSPEGSDNNTVGQLRELHQKLAQAYLSLGDVENAGKEFHELERLQNRQAFQHGNSAKSGEARLPAKLLISVPKGLLEQAGAGKISFDEFKKVLIVEELSFSKPNAAN